MKNTRFMEVLFSAMDNNDEELTNQVASDIEAAKRNGVVEDDEVKYESNGDGSVSITDKETGEVTVAENAEDEAETYDLYPAEMNQQIEGYLHPEMDGVTPGMQQGAPDEYVESHMDGSSVIAPNRPDGGLNPQAGHEGCVEDLAIQGPDGCCDDRQFSVSTDNEVVLRIFSDQEFCEKIFSEVIESEETAKVGDLKVEKIPEEDAVLVTSESTGDQAKVEFDGEDMNVTELDSKNFSIEEQYESLHVVGVDPINHVIVDAPEYCPESAQELVERLTEQGVDAVQIFDNPEDAREYAISLLENLGVEDEGDVEEPEQAEFSDHTIYLTRYYSSHTEYMDRLFSEVANGVEISQAAIEDAIENGDQIENDTEVVTPIDSKSAVVEDKDNGEFTKVTLDGDALDAKPISEEEAEELTSHIAVSDEEEDEEEEKDFSDIYCDEYETKFFSVHEDMTDYMVRLFSEEADSAEIEDAIESGEEIENDTEIITPVDAKTAVIEDKENGEFTKAVMDDEKLDVTPISEEQAQALTGDLEVGEEKDFSVYSDEYETKFFSAAEEMTEYMIRLFSEEADSDEIEDAIESGEQIENDEVVITPVDANTAIIEDKENGEFTKAVMDDEKLDVTPISEEEADELTDNLVVEEEEEKEFSDNPILGKFFADVQQGMAQPAPGAPAPAATMPAPQVPVDQYGNPVPAAPQPMSVEAIEDKAVAAVQSIQAAASEAEAMIMNAKAAPVEGSEADLQEAQFSEFEYDDEFNQVSNTLTDWLNNNMMGY